MKVALGKTDGAPMTNEFREEYRRALQNYLANADEAGLGLAYELGRKALAASQSLMEIASTHGEVLTEALERESEQSRANALRAGANFFTETLSPYEMAHRGFQDAVTALRQMNERLEEQIKKIAYAVHDDAGQLLVAVHLALASLATALPQAQQGEIIRIEGLLNEVEKQLRQYSHELRPTVLDDLGWVPAIRFLADGVSKRSKLPIHVQADFSERLIPAAEIAIYRVVQEALNNAVKHSNASTVSISARREGDALHCSILDNGVGFDMRDVRGKGQKRGLGLTAIQERMNAVGGTVQIESVPGRGTKLMITLPLEKLNANSSRTRG